MKALLPLLFVLVISPAFGQSLVNEPFNYPTGALGSPWAFINSGNAPSVVGSGLSYPGYSSAGNAVSISSAGGKEAYLPFSAPVTTGTAYASFLLNLSTAAATGDYFFCLSKNAPVGTNYMGRLYAQSSGAGYQLGLAKSTATPSYASQNLAYGTTYLVVIRYTFVSGTTNDQVDLFIDPTSLSVEGTPAASATTTDSDGNSPNLETVVLRQARTSSSDFTPDAVLDEIHVSSTYTESLPVELTYFRAQSAPGGTVSLTWATASEKNSSHFIVERSTDALSYAEIARLDAAGSTGQAQHYAATDAQPQPGQNYYRLRQVDLDGTTHQYRPVAVFVEGTEANPAALYPNPSVAGQTISLHVAAADRATVSVVSIQGRTIPCQFLTDSPSDGQLRAEAPMAPGVYLVRVQTPDSGQTLRWVVR